jgi:hypothetical protein
MQKKYIVDGNLKHDSQTYSTGDILMMEEEQATPLVETGRLKPAVEDITPQSAPAAPDGFPDRSVSQAPPASAPAAPASGQPQTPPKQPTQEQIAKDMEQIA